MGITTYVEPDIRTMIGSLHYSCRRACWISRIQLHITIEGETKLISIHMTCDMIHFYYLTLYPVSSSHHIHYLIISRLFKDTPCLSVIPYLVSQQNVYMFTFASLQLHKITYQLPPPLHPNIPPFTTQMTITTCPPPPHCLALLSIIHQINGWTVLTYLTTLQACTDIKSYIYIYVCYIVIYIYIWWTYFIKLIIYIICI